MLQKIYLIGPGGHTRRGWGGGVRPPAQLYYSCSFVITTLHLQWIYFIINYFSTAYFIHYYELYKKILA